MPAIIAIWLRAWVLACLSEIFPLSITGMAVSLIPDSLDVHALHSLSEGLEAVIIQFVEWISAPLFLIAVGYFDTS